MKPDPLRTDAGLAGSGRLDRCLPVDRLRIIDRLEVLATSGRGLSPEGFETWIGNYYDKMLLA